MSTPNGIDLSGNELQTRSDVLDRATRMLTIIGKPDTPSATWEAAQEMVGGKQEQTRLVGLLTLLEYANADWRESQRRCMAMLMDLRDELQRRAAVLGIAPLMTFPYDGNTKLEEAHGGGQCVFDLMGHCFRNGAPSEAATRLYKAALRQDQQIALSYNSPRAPAQRLAMLLMIDAALGDPQALMRGISEIRANLVNADLGLALVGGDQ